MLLSPGTGAAAQATAYDQARSPFGLREILAYIGQNDAVLDAGCGTGQHALAIAALADTVVGVDVDTARLSVAHSRGAGLRNLSFRAGSLTELPFEDGSFDVVVVAQVLHHLAGDDVVDADVLRGACRTAIAEVRRVLRKGGRLILVTTSRTQRRNAYWHFNLFPATVWEGLKCVWSLSEGEWFQGVLRDNSLREVGRVSPVESHWLEFEGVDMVVSSLDPEWRSTDVAFDLMTEDELGQFVVRAKRALEDGSAKRLVAEADKGRETHGEATIFLCQDEGGEGS